MMIGLQQVHDDRGKTFNFLNKEINIVVTIADLLSSHKFTTHVFYKRTIPKNCTTIEHYLLFLTPILKIVYRDDWIISRTACMYYGFQIFDIHLCYHF